MKERLPQLVVTGIWVALVLFFTFAIDDGWIDNPTIIKMFVTGAPGISILIFTFWFTRPSA